MKRIGSEVVGALFWLAIGVFFAGGGVLLEPGTLRNPGPGFLPLIMASLLVAFSLVVLVQGLLRPEPRGKAIGWRSQAALVASVFLYGWVIDFGGFLLSTFALMVVLFSLLSQGKGRWPRVVLYAAATAVLGWLVFSVALRVPFPRGHLMVVEGWKNGFLR